MFGLYVIHRDLDSHSNALLSRRATFESRLSMPRFLCTYTSFPDLYNIKALYDPLRLTRQGLTTGLPGADSMVWHGVGL